MYRPIHRIFCWLMLVWMGSVFQTGAETGTIRDVQHVVILSLENRSFDHYYGCLGGVRGFGDPNALIWTNGQSVLFQPSANGFTLPFHSPTQCLGDVLHDEGTGLWAWDWGWCDAWVAAKGTSCMTYFNRDDLAFYYALADAYTICDAYHCSVMGPTCPNRLYLMSGMVDPNGTGGGPVLANVVPTNGYAWTTYPERLQKAGISWRVYQPGRADYFNINALSWFSQYMNSQPGNPLYDRGIALVDDVVSAFGSDVSNGTLPRVSWILPGFSTSEHPAYPPANGEWLTERLLQALASNRQIYNSTVFFVTYDENGGFFDHVPPPVPPPGTPDEFVYGYPIGLGVRVPLLIISPWTRGGHVFSQVCDHTSLLRFLEACTGVTETNISAWRRQVCGDLTAAFDFSAPNTNFPALPAVTPIICTNGAYPSPPVSQIPPIQESTLRARRFLPYQPNAICLLDCTNNQVPIEFTNSGRASVHFSVYGNKPRMGPWEYDVRAKASTTDWFLVSTNPAGVYDLTCYGPNGFQRHFAGNLAANCGKFELRSSLDLDAGGIAITLTNASAVPVGASISNAWQAGDVRSYTVLPHSSSTDLFLAETNNRGSYDLTVTTATDPLFVRRLAGHIETGAPQIRARHAGGQLQLSYPGWAAGYTLEAADDLTTATWQPLSISPIILSNRVLVTVPMQSGVAYFRLRR